MTKWTGAAIVLLVVGCASISHRHQNTSPSLTTADVNGSGTVSRLEYKQYYLDRFSSAAPPAQGAVKVADLCPGAFPASLCEGADTSGDGKISVQEFLNRLDKEFAKTDKDGNRTLSPEELQ